MKSLNRRLIIGLATILAGAYTQIAIAADVTGTATAEVLAPLAISQTTEMDFGQVAGDSSNATTVVLTTSGTTSSADGAYTDATAAAGAFAVTGANNLFYSITLPSAAVTLNRQGGGASMTVDSFNHDAAASPQLSSSGTGSFNVGATLNLGAGQLAGIYDGTYTVTVDYQ